MKYIDDFCVKLTQKSERFSKNFIEKKTKIITKNIILPTQAWCVCGGGGVEDNISLNAQYLYLACEDCNTYKKFMSISRIVSKIKWALD